MHDLNYYDILELDPDVADEAVIERRIQEKQRLWSRQTTEGTPRDARVAARNLKLLDAMRKAMTSPTERTAHAARARQQRDERLREARSRLTEFLGFAKGRVDDVENFITRDCARFVRELGRDEVRRLVTAAGITAALRQAAHTPPRRETLEPATTRRIRDGLEHVGKKDLYDFLGLTRRCTAKSLRDRAEELNRSLLRSGRSDDQTSAAKELAGQCMAVFDSEDGRTRYNHTLIDEALDITLKDFLPLAGKDGAISPRSFADLLAIAARQGVPANDAAQFIRAYAQRKRWTLQEGGEVSIAPTLPPCGYCGCIPHNEAETFCWNCQRKLTIICPACGESIHSSMQHCTSCGVNVADAEIVEELFREATQAAENGHAEQALKLVNRCLSLWPQWSEARELKEKLTEQRRLQQSYSRRLVGLLRERRMNAAQDCLDEAIRECGPAAFGRAAEIISRTLADANRLYVEGEGYRLEGTSEGAAEEAAERFEQALALCTDLQNAKEALRRMPVPAPKMFTVESMGQNTVRISWEPGKADVPFVYTLVRKLGGLPGAVDDGLVLQDAAPACLFDDTTVTGGTSWYYAVFAARRELPDVLSPPVGFGPVFLVPPLSVFAVRGDDERCFLSWVLPEGAVAAEIWRMTCNENENPDMETPDTALHTATPGSEAQNAGLLSLGTVISLPQRSATPEGSPLREGHAIDTGLTNGQTYIYTGAAVYTDHTDQAHSKRYSACVRVRVSPAPRLDPVDDLRVALHNGRAYAHWTPPAAGRVLLLAMRNNQHNPMDFHGSVPVDSLAHMGTLAHSAEELEHTAMFAEPANTLLLPVTTRGNLALAGRICQAYPLEDVSNLAAAQDKGGLSLTWDWPEGVDSVRVFWSTTSPPQTAKFAPPESPAVSLSPENTALNMSTGNMPSSNMPSSDMQYMEFTRELYTAQGSCVLAPIPVQKHFVRVCACVPGHEHLHTEGVPLVCSMGVVDVVNYRVLRTGLFKKTATAVELRCDTLKNIDNLLLHAREGAVPLSPTDGVTIAMVDRLEFHRGVVTIPIPERFRSSRMLIRLFFAKPDQAGGIRLMPGGLDELRLF